MNLKKSFTIAIVLIIAAIGFWELYWRSQGYYPTLDDNNALWAVQRGKLEKLKNEDVVLFGSSRVLFDIQLDAWENITGVKPIQLATAGATPLPAFRDLVKNTNFSGTVVVGVTPGLFFSTTNENASPWNRIKERIDYFEDRTYAQRLNHYLSLPLQNNLAFISDVEGIDGINLGQLLSKIQIGNRLGEGMPPFHEFSDIAVDRNTKMRERTVTDTVFANTVKTIWKFFGQNAKPLEKEATMAFFIEDAIAFNERGGNLILLRCPSTGYYKDGEAQFATRTEYWDELVKQSQANGYHYNDYPQLNHFDCPEWSHLSAEDAVVFTTELAKIMKKDNALTKFKSN